MITAYLSELKTCEKEYVESKNTLEIRLITSEFINIKLSKLSEDRIK